MPPSGILDLSKAILHRNMAFEQGDFWDILARHTDNNDLFPSKLILLSFTLDSNIA